MAMEVNNYLFKLLSATSTLTSISKISVQLKIPRKASSTSLMSAKTMSKDTVWFGKTE
jgi:hypothetical protein